MAFCTGCGGENEDWKDGLCGQCRSKKQGEEESTHVAHVMVPVAFSRLKGGKAITITMDILVIDDEDEDGVFVSID